MSRDVPSGHRHDGEVTLAFDLAAFERLLDPASVFADARRWSRYVGVVGDDADVVEASVARHDVRQDYEIGEYDKQSVLSRLKWESDSPRYVYVGTDDRDAELAEYVGWEFITIEEAAKRADWRLKGRTSRIDQLRTRLRRSLRGRLP